MLSTSLLKRLATALLLLSLALPSYTCSGYVGPDGRRVGEIPTGADRAAYQPARVPHYALESYTPGEVGFWVVLLAFTWPIPILILRRREMTRLSRWLWWAEPVCAIAAGWLIWAIATLGRPAIGTYLALGATGILVLAWLAEARRVWRARGSPARLHPAS